MEKPRQVPRTGTKSLVDESLEAKGNPRHGPCKATKNLIDESRLSKKNPRCGPHIATKTLIDESCESKKNPRCVACKATKNLIDESPESKRKLRCGPHKATKTLIDESCESKKNPRCVACKATKNLIDESPESKRKLRCGPRKTTKNLIDELHLSKKSLVQEVVLCGPRCGPPKTPKTLNSELLGAKKNPKNKPRAITVKPLTVCLQKARTNSRMAGSCKVTQTPNHKTRKAMVNPKYASCTAVKNSRSRLTKPVKRLPTSLKAAQKHEQGLSAAASYSIIKKYEAAKCMKDNDQKNAANYLAEAHSVTLTERALIAYQTSPRPYGKEGASSIFDEQAELLHCHGDLLDMRDTLRKLPSDWTVIQLTTQLRKAMMSEDCSTPALFLTHGQCGVYCDVHVMQVPAPQNDISIMKEFQELLEAHMLLDTNYVGTRKKYWEKRAMHSQMLQQLLSKMESNWLCEKKCLLLGRFEDCALEEEAEKFVARTEMKLNLKLHAHNKFLLKKLIECCYNMSAEEILWAMLNILKNDDVEIEMMDYAAIMTYSEKALACVFSKLTVDAEEEDPRLLFKQLKIMDKEEMHFDSEECGKGNPKKKEEQQLEKSNSISMNSKKLRQKLKDAVTYFLSMRQQMKKFEAAKRHPVILIVDNEIQMLPWEVLPILCQQPISRTSSLRILAFLYETHMSTTRQKEVDHVESFYMLNPDGSLMGVQQYLESYFSKTFEKQGFVGTIPNPEVFTSALQRNDLVIYCGHGSRSKYIPRKTMQKIQWRPTTLLLGCHSTQLKEQAQHLDPTDTLHHYIFASSPCVMGMLWDVTDQDCDHVTLDLLKKWLPGDEQKEKDFLKAVMLCRRAAMHFITGAAIVVYGLPVEIRKTSWLEN